jgi:hypothetical protein
VNELSVQLFFGVLHDQPKTKGEGKCAATLHKVPISTKHPQKLLFESTKGNSCTITWGTLNCYHIYIFFVSLMALGNGLR